MSQEPPALADIPPPRPARFVLAPLGPEDAADVLAHFADPRVVEFLDIDPIPDLEEASETIAWAQGRLAAGAGVRWGIRAADGGAFVGTCGFNSLVFQRGRRGEVAYDVSPAWWGRRVMDEIMPMLIDFGFAPLRLRRLEAMVTPGNHRSCALLERHGFVREGTLRDYGYWKGRYFDQIVFGLTRSGEGPTL